MKIFLKLDYVNLIFLNCLNILNFFTKSNKKYYYSFICNMFIFRVKYIIAKNTI